MACNEFPVLDADDVVDGCIGDGLAVAGLLAGRAIIAATLDSAFAFAVVELPNGDVPVD